MRMYILEGKTPKPIDSSLDWAMWYEKANRHVNKTELPGNIMVSTVFLGLDHGWNGELVLFETMIFGGDHDGYQERYATWEDAEKGHQMAIEMVFV